MYINQIPRLRLKCILVAFFLATINSSLLAAPVEDNNKPLIMGVFPIVTSGVLFKRFAPLKDYLAKQLGQDIVLQTAKDFPTFVQRTAERRYDIVVTAPHFSLLAADSGDYQIVVRPKKNLESLLVVAKNSKITNVSQLSGKLIATPPKPALTTRSGKDHLESMGLVGENSPSYRAYKTHNAAYQSVIGNDSAAAIVSNNILSKALKRGVPLRVIDKLPPLPAMATLVATNLNEKFAIDVEKALVTMTESEQGLTVLKKVGFPGYLSAGVDDYEIVRPYKPASAIIGKNKK